MAEAMQLPTIEQVLTQTFTVIWKIVKIPVMAWLNLPAWVKLSMLILLLMMCLLIIVLVIKKRNEWRFKYY